MTLWEIDIYPAEGQPDLKAREIAADAADLGVADDLPIQSARGFLIEGDLSEEHIRRVTDELLSNGIVERAVIAPAGDPQLSTPTNGHANLVHVLPKPGVMDPVAQSTKKAIDGLALGSAVSNVRTLKKYWVGEVEENQLERLCDKVLANDSIEEVIVGPLSIDKLDVGSDYQFEKVVVPLRSLSDAELETLSRDGQLYLTLTEMQTIQAHFQSLDRDPTDVELETVAQTWSEHCSHKTLAGRIAYKDDKIERQFENMLKETIFAATQQIRATLGDDDWCVSVFEDNAGVVTFDDEYHVVFKVETHNHPSAIEPYGGANTGIGGVIRDPLGTGMGAKPICNTDVFCFAPPDTPASELPPGVLHPRRVMKGVVSGVRDYGNRMGIPTVNGAIYFDPRYLGNPLVYCGNAGLLPVGMESKEVIAGDLIVAIGGRTGRDGIHGATFSSAELTSESESVSGGAVQIGNAITEKMVLDVLLQARDRNLYHAVTDCGAGGFSSAVGEMGEEVGAEVWLDKAPVKYDGLSYTEIWISEAQERMVLAVPEENWQALHDLCAAEGVEATVLGRFVPTGRLELKYHDQSVADLSMEFLHDGRPPVIRDAVFTPPAVQPINERNLAADADGGFNQSLKNILGSLNVASKEWVIRQYDHEVQGGSVIKPLVGIQNDGPSDAAVLRPRLTSYRGLVISCGMNPRYGDYDPYHMAASAIDEAIRNCVAVGADPTRIAILDNFCWGYTDRAETLGALVRSALACYDLAVELQTPFISGKDSLNNEFSYQDDSGNKQTISIPHSLLISAMGQVADVRQCVTMDAKSAGNLVYIVGETHEELGGSHLGLVRGFDGGKVPQVNASVAKSTFAAMHVAISGGLLRSCHDLSEGGLAVAAAEMAFAGGLGIELDLSNLPTSGELSDAAVLFAESNTRFLCEVTPDNATAFEAAHASIPHAKLGTITDNTTFTATRNGTTLLDADIADLKEAWQSPLRW